MSLLYAVQISDLTLLVSDKHQAFKCYRLIVKALKTSLHIPFVLYIVKQHFWSWSWQAAKQEAKQTFWSSFVNVEKTALLFCAEYGTGVNGTIVQIFVCLNFF